MSQTIVPVADLPRLPEHGRIRLGEKTGKAMKFNTVFRFTSPDRDAIESLAAQYGGTAQPWNEPTARIANQWEVRTTTSEIAVLLPPNALSSWYETWAGGGCIRRCDGNMCTVPGVDDMVTKPCLCETEWREQQVKMSCKPYTRLNVVLPTIRFGGTWRVETKGQNAARELAAVEQMIQALAPDGKVLLARLSIEERHEKVMGKPRHFVVPKLSLDATPTELLQGSGTVAALASGAAAMSAAAALPVASLDDEVVDAEIVVDDPGVWVHAIREADSDQLDAYLHDLEQLVFEREPIARNGMTQPTFATIFHSSVLKRAVRGRARPIEDRREIAQALVDILEGRVKLDSYDPLTNRFLRRKVTS